MQIATLSPYTAIAAITLPARPPILPAIVFFGLTAGQNFGPPIALPTNSAITSPSSGTAKVRQRSTTSTAFWSGIRLRATRLSPGSATVSSGSALILRSVSSGSFRNRICVIIINSARASSGTITFTPKSQVSGIDTPRITQVGQVTTRCPAMDSA